MLIVKNRKAFKKHVSMSRQEQSFFEHFSHAMNVCWDSSTSQFYPYFDLAKLVLF